MNKLTLELELAVGFDCRRLQIATSKQIHNCTFFIRSFFLSFIHLAVVGSFSFALHASPSLAKARLMQNGCVHVCMLAVVGWGHFSMI